MKEALMLFAIIASGYLLGSINIKGIKLGCAGVLIMGLVFGHFGVTLDESMFTFGLVCTVCSIGFLAGPGFFANFKLHAKSYVVLGIFIILIGTVCCKLIIELGDIPLALGVGMLMGGLTSSPGLAAAIESAGPDGYLASVGYGLAYPFGVAGVILFVQLVPKLLHLNMAEERAKYEHDKVAVHEPKKTTHTILKFDPYGIFIFMAASIVGLLLGKIAIPLPGGADFSLGASGAPLLVGLFCGYFKQIGWVSIEVKKETLNYLQLFGLMLFYAAVGTNAGHGFVQVLRENGYILFVYGMILTLVPMLGGYFFAKKVLKLEVLNNLGAITGGMTSTPSLAALIEVSGTEDVASAYAATYPIALVCVVLSAQILYLI